jgi:NADH:ubiquinone oxidoreductase subunit 5 (subunit L)/multisubunit Na+/H+ antiporter MnhA subunit
MKFVNAFLSFLFLIPSLLSVFQYFLGRKEDEKNLSYVNLAGTFMATLIFSGIFVETPIASQWDLKWVSLPSLTIHWGGEMNKTSSLFLLVFMWMNVGAKLFVKQLCSLDSASQARFFLYTDFLLLGMFVALSATYFFPLLIGWTILSLISYLLLSFSYENGSSNQAAFTAFLYDQGGNLCLLVTGSLTIFSYGDLSFGELKWQTVSQGWLGVLFFLAICCKLFQFGMNTWVSRSLEIPSYVLAIVVNFILGIPAFLLLWRLHLLEVPLLKSVSFYLGMVTFIFATGAAFIEPFLKKVAVYLTVAYWGLLLAFSPFGFYEVTLGFMVVLSFMQFLLFGMERALSSRASNTFINLNDSSFESFMGGEVVGIFVLWGLLHTGLLAVMGIFILSVPSLQTWIIASSLGLLSIVIWRPVFLFVKSYFSKSRQRFLPINYYARDTLFLGVGAVMMIGLFFSFWLFISSFLDGRSPLVLGVFILIGSGVVLGAVNIFLLKDFGGTHGKNEGRCAQIILHQGSLEGIYRLGLAIPFKWISAAFSEQIDQTLIEDKTFSGSVQSLNKIHQFVAWIQAQAFSFYLIALLVGCSGLLFFFMLK